MNNRHKKIAYIISYFMSYECELFPTPKPHFSSKMTFKSCYYLAFSLLNFAFKRYDRRTTHFEYNTCLQNIQNSRKQAVIITRNLGEYFFCKF